MITSDEIAALREQGFANSAIAGLLKQSEPDAKALADQGFSDDAILEAFVSLPKAGDGTPPTTTEQPPTTQLDGQDVVGPYTPFTPQPEKDWPHPFPPTIPDQGEMDKEMAMRRKAGGMAGVYDLLEETPLPLAGATKQVYEAMATPDAELDLVGGVKEKVSNAAERESIPRILTGLAAELAVSEGGKYAATRVGAKRGAGGAMAGYVAGALASGAGGSILAQEIEGKEKISWGRVIADSFLNALPMSEAKSAPKVVNKLAKVASDSPVLTSAVVGTTAGAGTNVLEQAFEGEGIDAKEVAQAGAVTGGLGIGLGSLQRMLGSRYKKLLGKSPDHLEQLVIKGDQDAVGYLNFLLQDVPEERIPQLGGKGYIASLVERGIARAAPSKALTTEVMQAARRVQNAPAAQKDFATIVGQRIDRAVQKAVRTHGPEIEDGVMKYLTGEVDELPSQLPRSVRDDLVTSRQEVFRLQADILENHYNGTRPLEKPLLEAIESSLKDGNYLSRSYRLFADPSYKPTPTQFDRAVRSLVRGGMSQQKAQEYLIGLNERRAGNFADVANYMHSSRSGVLKEKNYDLPLEVREYLGEYTKPGEKLAETQSRLSKMVEYDVANKTIERSMIESGIARPASAQVQGWVPFKIQGKDVVVDGHQYYIPKHADKALAQVYGIHETVGGNLAAQIGKDAYQAATSLFKAVKVLGNLPAYAVQLYGNLGGTANSLNNPFRGSKSGILAGLAGFRPIAKRMPVKRLLQNKEFQELGLTGQSLAFEDFIKSTQRGGGPLSATVRGLFSPLGKIYSGFDDTLRIVNYKNFEDTLIRSTNVSSQSDLYKLKRFAAEIVNDIYPNYAHLNESLKTLTQMGAPVSQFASFGFELARNQYNHVAYAKRMMSGEFAEELMRRTGLKITNPKAISNKGAQMMGGFVGMHAMAIAGIKGYNRTVGGMSEEDERAWRETGAAPWDAEANTILHRAPDGDTVFSTTASYMLTHAQLSGYGLAFMRGDSLSDSFGKMLGAVISDMGGDGSFASRATIEALNNIDLDTGNPISHRTDLVGRVHEVLGRTMAKHATPGTVREIKKAKEQDWSTTIARQAGIRINTNSFETGLKIKSKEVKDAFVNLASEAHGLKWKLADKKITPEQYEQEYQRLNISYRQRGEQLVKHFKNSRQWGLQDKEIVTHMKEAGVGSIKILDAMQGKVSDLPKNKIPTARDIYDAQFADKPLEVQQDMLSEMENEVMALSVRDIIKSEARAKYTGQNVMDDLYKAIPAASGERAQRIYHDLKNSPNPEATEQRFLETGVIDKATMYHLNILREAQK